MTSTVWIALSGTALAALPVLLPKGRGRLSRNPAVLMLVIVAMSLLLETLYVVLLRPRPLESGYDRIYVRATSQEFLLAGAVVVLVAVCGYVGGFFVLRRGTLPEGLLARDWMHAPFVAKSRQVMLWLLLLCLASFVAYLFASGTSLTSGPLAAKRFQPAETGVASRFLYLPYYFFKLAMTSSSIVFAAALLLTRSSSAAHERRDKFLFAGAFLLTLGLGHFASLRLFVLLPTLAVGLLVAHSRPLRHVAFFATFLFLTFASMFLTTAIRPGSSPSPEGMERLDRSSRVSGTMGALTVRLRHALAPVFEGRYLMDVTKLGLIAQHFPDEVPFLLGRSFFDPPEAVRHDGTFDRYLSRAVFDQPTNSVPAGFAGELYVNLGLYGLFFGFTALGAFHRFVLDVLSMPGLPVVLLGAFIALIPSTTVVLINSGLLAAVSRSVLDVAVILLVWSPAVLGRGGLVSTPQRERRGPPHNHALEVR